MEIIVLETNNEEQIAELKALAEIETSVDVIVIVDNKPINKGFEPESFTISENKYYEDYPISKNGKGKKTKSWEKSKYQ